MLRFITVLLFAATLMAEPLTQKAASYLNITKPEDFIQLPHSSWVVISSMQPPVSGGGELLAVDTQNLNAAPKRLYRGSNTPEERATCKALRDGEVYPRGMALYAIRMSNIHYYYHQTLEPSTAFTLKPVGVPKRFDNGRKRRAAAIITPPKIYIHK